MAIKVLQNTEYTVSHSDAIKVAGEDKTLTEKLREVDNAVYLQEVIDLSTFTVNKKLFIGGGPGSYIWNKNLENYNCIFVPVTAGNRYTITANSSKNARFAFMTSNVVGNNQAAVTTFADANEVHLDLQTGNTKTYTAPAGATFMYVAEKLANNSYLPASIVESTTIKNDVKTLNEEVSQINEEIYIFENIDLESYKVNGVIIGGGSGSYSWAAHNSYNCYLIPIGESKKFKIVANSEHVVRYAWLRDNAHIQNTAPNFVLGTEVYLDMSAGDVKVVTAPDNASYLYVLGQGVNSSQQPVVYKPSKVLVKSDLQGILDDCVEKSDSANIKSTLVENALKTGFETVDSFNEGSDTDLTTEVINSTSTEPISRTPDIVVTNAKTLLLAYIDKEQWADSSLANLIVARKTNGGSWSKKTVVEKNSVATNYRPSNHSFVIDRNTGRIYLFVMTYTHTGVWTAGSTCDVGVMYSDNDGESWSELVSIKSASTISNGWDTSKYVAMVCGPVGGCQLADGTLVIPAMGFKIVGNAKKYFSGIIYKKSGEGSKWTFSSPTPNLGDNECTVYEGKNANEIMLYCRNENEPPVRNLYRYDMEHDTWETVHCAFVPKVNLSAKVIKAILNNETRMPVWLLSYNDSTSLTINNGSIRRIRERETIWISNDVGITWNRALRINDSTYDGGYTCIDYYDGKLVLAYELGTTTSASINYMDLTPAIGLFKDAALPIEDRLYKLTCALKGLTE